MTPTPRVSSPLAGCFLSIPLILTFSRSLSLPLWLSPSFFMAFPVFLSFSGPLLRPYPLPTPASRDPRQRAAAFENRERHATDDNIANVALVDAYPINCRAFSPRPPSSADNPNPRDAACARLCLFFALGRSTPGPPFRELPSETVPGFPIASLG